MRQSYFCIFIFFLIGCAEDGVVDPNLFFPGGETNTTEKAIFIQGLALPLRLNFIHPKEMSSQRSPKTLRSLNDLNSDYHQDEIETRIKDVSMQPLQRINFLLCLLAQSQMAERINQGAYQVWINQQECQLDNKINNPDQAWTLEVTRLDNHSPQKVKVWVSDFTAPELNFSAANSTALLIELEIVSAVSAELPYGHFKMNFSTLMLSSSVAQGSLWSGKNSVGQNEVGFIAVVKDTLLENDESFSIAESLHFMLTDLEGDAGKMVSYQANNSESVGFEARFAAAFNAGYFYRAEDRDNDGLLEFNSRLCQARGEFDLHVPRYHLYHAEDGVFAGASILAGERLVLAADGLINNTPMMFQYQHSRANDLNDQQQWAGEEFFLQYGAAGELQGLPYAEVSLKAGTVLANQSHSFVLKPKMQEQVMRSVDDGWCADLDIDALFYDSAVSLPDVSQLELVDFGLEGQPVVLEN